MVELLHGLSHALELVGMLACPVSLVVLLVLLVLLPFNRRSAWARGACWVCIVVVVVSVAGTVLDALVSSRARSQETVCLSNVKQLSLGLVLYSQDYDERYPPAARWDTGAAAYLPRTERRTVFRCPAAESPFGYGLNSALGGVAVSDMATPSATVLLLEMDARTRNAVGGQRDLPYPGRHAWRDVIGLADGHAKVMPNWEDHRPEGLVWSPRPEEHP